MLTAFIDAANFFKLAPPHFDVFEINVTSLRGFLSQRFRTPITGIDIRYYYGRHQKEGSEDNDFVRRNHGVPHLTTIQTATCSNVFTCQDCKRPQTMVTQKGVDAVLSVDLVTAAARGLDVAVLFSGDGDFCHAVKAARSFGTEVAIAHWGQGVSSSLLHDAGGVELDLSKVGSQFIPERTMRAVSTGTRRVSLSKEATSTYGQLKALAGGQRNKHLPLANVLALPKSKSNDDYGLLSRAVRRRALFELKSAGVVVWWGASGSETLKLT